jgi:phosphoglycerate dehydrogenase-like enzyme
MTEAATLYRADVGIIGFGYVGKELLRLLEPFGCTVRIYDPWIPDSVIHKAGAVAVNLDTALSTSQFLFIAAGVTADNEGFLDAARLTRVPDGARVILVSRAAVVDFDALLDEVGSGRFFAGIDVWPVEPTPLDSRARGMDHAVLSPHRAGGTEDALYEIGEMIGDDLDLIVQGLAPVRMQPAAWELVRRYRSR